MKNTHISSSATFADEVDVLAFQQRRYKQTNDAKVVKGSELHHIIAVGQGRATPLSRALLNHILAVKMLKATRSKYVEKAQIP